MLTRSFLCFCVVGGGGGARKTRHIIEQSKARRKMKAPHSVHHLVAAMTTILAVCLSSPLAVEGSLRHQIAQAKHHSSINNRSSITGRQAPVTASSSFVGYTPSLLSSTPITTVFFALPPLARRRGGCAAGDVTTVSCRVYSFGFGQQQRRRHRRDTALLSHLLHSSNRNDDNDYSSSSNNNSNNNNKDDEELLGSSNIQRLYEQVQNEDSEWFYQTFSKLLVVDKNKINKNNENNVVRAIDEEKRERTNMIDNVMSDENGIGRRADNRQLMMEKSDDKDLVADVTEKAAAVALKEYIAATNISTDKDGRTTNRTSSKSRREIALLQQQQQQQRIRQRIKEETDYRPTATSSNDGVQQRKEEYKVEIEDVEGEYESLSKASDNNADEMSSLPPPRANKSKNDDDNNTESSSSSSSLPNKHIIRLRNIYNNEIENIGYLTPILNLGYTTKEILVLKPQVLELIIDDGITKPKKGLPKRWVRLSKLYGYNTKKETNDDHEEEQEDDDDFEWEVEVVSGTLMDNEKSSLLVNSKNKEQEFVVAKKESSDTAVADASIPTKSQRKSQTENGNRKQRQQSILEEEEGDDDTRSNRYRGSANTRTGRSKPLKKFDDEGEKSRSSRRRMIDTDEERRQKKRMQQQHPPSPQRRELLIDRGVDNDEDDDNFGAGNKFWMDLPTFRDFLRKEAKFRLQILGPDWKESVLDESKWRYDLYKTWLTMLDDGVGGENPLYEYGDRPRPRRRKSSSSSMPQPRSRGEQRNRRPTRIEVDEEGRDYNINERDRPNNRRESRSETPRDGGRRGEGNRRRTKDQSSISSSTPASLWKNFSDLEESMIKGSSSQTSLRKEKGSSTSNAVVRGRDMLYAHEEEEEEYDETI